MHHHSFVMEMVLIVFVLLAMWYATTHFTTVKRAIIGKPKGTREIHSAHTKLFWMIALPILSADLYSSVAYGPEAGITELAGLGRSAQWLILPLTGSTIVLLAILITSYIMGIMAYPSGGGAYAIAKDNFKRPLPSLIASSSLLVDYILTVAVSVSAGVDAMASAYPALVPYETSLALLSVVLLVIVNLRGVTESASVFAWPTFVFMGCMLLLIGAGFLDELRHGFVQNVTPPLGSVPQGLTWLLILKAFSSACSALTGIETISNAVPIFREPKQKSAIKTYIALGVITAVTLLGFAYHLYVKGIPVDPHNTMLSQLATQYFGHTIIYQVIMWMTFIVLILAANSTFTGFSQLSAIVAADGYLPRVLRNRGDRLGYSNGIILLAGISCILIEIFQAQTNALIPLYAIGVFLSFTVAQIGLCRRWLRVQASHKTIKFSVNLIGAIVTSLVAIVFSITKFTSGAWIVLIILPLIILFSVSVRRHYTLIANELRIDPKTSRPEDHHVQTLVLISGIHRVVKNTLSFAKSLDTDVVALYIGFDDESIAKMKEKWVEWGEPCELVILYSEFRSIIRPLSRYIKKLEAKEGQPNHIHIVMSQFIPSKWWHNFLHNQSAFLIRAWLLRHKEVVITTVPYHLHD